MQRTGMEAITDKKVVGDLTANRVGMTGHKHEATDLLADTADIRSNLQ